MERTRDRHADQILEVNAETLLNTPHFPSELPREHPGYLLLDLIANSNTILRECLF